MVPTLVILLWLLTVAAALLAVLAWTRARHGARRLERLAESYWELRYEYGQLRARVTALEPQAADADSPPAGPPPGTTAFVPLSSLKR